MFFCGCRRNWTISLIMPLLLRTYHWFINMAKIARITGLIHLEQFTISKTENVSCVIPQRNIKVLNNDLLMTFTGTVTRYYTEKFPSLEEISISNFVWEKNALSTKALDDFFHHIAKKCQALSY